jgi:hypothetical protein
MADALNSRTDEPVIYREEVKFKFIYYVIIIEAIFTIIAGTILYRQFGGQLEALQKMKPVAFFVAIGFVTSIALALALRKLVITLTSSVLLLKLGWMKTRIPLSSIVRVFPDDKTALSYGGWGVKYARIEGKWRKVYNTFGGARLVVEVSGGKFQEIAFSVSNPDYLKSLIENQIQAGK